jgi:hypothetical protein
MTSQFTTTELVNDRVLVEGVDRLGTTAKTVLNSAQYNELKGTDAFAEAEAAFQKTVEKFYAPLTKAADALENVYKNAGKEDLFVEVVQEAVAPTAGLPEVRVILSKDTVILRLIEKGETDRLIWVGDSLEISA